MELESERKYTEHHVKRGDEEGADDAELNEEETDQKLRVRSSAVHEHFDKVQISHPKTKKIVDGSTCKYCKTVFINRVTTNLKCHLKSKHPEAFDEVNRKFLFV